MSPDTGTKTRRRREPLQARPPAEDPTAVMPTPTPVIDDVVVVPGEPVPPERGRLFQSPRALVAEIRDAAPAVGMVPLWILLGISLAERFDASAYGVLGPEIRHAFHLSNSSFQSIFGLTAIVPLLLAVPIGVIADRTNRVRLARWGALAWGATCIGTGAAPLLGLFVLFRIAGGSGQTVNQPVHPSLLSDYYPPQALAPVFSFYLLAPAAIGLAAGPIAGGLSAIAGWRLTFILLALPTFALVAVMSRLEEPRRGASIGVEVTDEKVSMGEAFRRLKAIRSLKRTWWAAAFFGGGVIAFTNLLSIFFNDTYGLGSFARGAVSALFGAAGVVGIVVGGQLAQREMKAGRPQRLAFVNGALVVLFGAGIAVMGASPFLIGSLVGVFVLSIGAAGFAPAYTTMVALVTPPKLRSQAYAWSLVWVALGAGLVSPIIGGFGDAFNQRVAALVLAALVGMAGFVEITATRFVKRDIDEAGKGAIAAESGALLTVRGLDVAYDGGVQVLFGVDFDVHAGEIIALLGTNGAGKSTLLRAISGLMDPIGGVIYFDGRDITHADAVTKTGLGIVQVPGGRGVFPSLSVAENLKIAGWVYRKDTAYLAEATERVLQHFPILREYWDLPAANLSGGQQQMLTLAQALLARPKLLMIDELSLGLAPVIVEQLLETVRALAADGTTIILVEQSVNVALTVADTAYFMEKGEIRFKGPTADLLERPDVLRSVFLEGAGTVSGDSNGRHPARARRVVAPTSTDAPVLEVRQMSKRFGGVTAVSNVDLRLLPNQILGIIGPNGAGKTTLFDLISGYVLPDGGSLHLGDLDLTRAQPDVRARLGLGRSFQDARLFPGLTVTETIALALERQVEVRDPLAAALNLPSVIDSEAAVNERVDELVELMGITAFRDKFVSELSTGSRRIVDLACILAHDPSVILFDEPSSGIAQRETEALGPLLLRIRDATNASLLVIEHDMPLITSISDEIVAMELGAVVVQGPAESVVRDPRVVASYLGSSDEVVNRSGKRGATA